MKIAIDLGHGVGQDRGANSIIAEETIINNVGALVIKKLRAMGHTVIEVRPGSATTVTNSLNQRTTKANANNVDLFVSIHANAGGGKGTEVYTYGARQLTQAKNVLNNIVSLGFTNRGIKDGSHLYVIRHTSASAMLIEVCFVDTKSDVDLYTSLSAGRVSDAIVKGLVGSTTNVSSQSSATSRGWVYELQGVIGATQDNIAGPETLGKCPLLKVGSKGNITKLIQERLISLGYSCGSCGADGDFGNGTYNAVIKYQKAKGLSADGIVGKNTWRKLLGL